ncbi:cytochrome c biogenesis protein CcsA [Paraglaciecola aquimarina]|uniref:Cytochrome c biogenesis protein CcsA n=1 Tax=Paraglaciecola aquimarina TaxID=1235557 RepID=A0ABU3SZS2_9ALTE|nr:cytochrome c biogenesis protein CcsA [Paraglaciecola aquimarina]MDU0355507.1 cytochrome c biogenesis protein CcsA [Paraglaciecola aquimarina]
MLLEVLCFGLYFLTSGIIVTGMFSERGPNKRLAMLTVICALVLHSLILKSTVFVELGQNMSMLNVASLIGWLISITMLVASIKVPNTILLPVVYGFTGAIVIFSRLMPDAHVMQVSVQPTLLLHVSLALFAYACLGIAFLYALQLSYINFRLKEKNASLLHSSLPPLMDVERILFKLLLVGTVLLTLSLISGFMFLDNMFAKEQAHKTILSILSWAIYSVILFGHAKFGWRGKSVITFTIIGGFLLTLAYFGSRFVREVLLN